MNNREHTVSVPTHTPAQDKQIRKKRRRKKRRLFFRIFLLVFLVAVLAGMGIFYVKYGDTLLTWQKEAKQLVGESTEDTFKNSEASMVYASNGAAIAKLKGDKDSTYLKFEDIPQYVKDAFVVTEDRDFYEHSGFDPKAIMSAGVQLIKSKLRGAGPSRGGSTITQQLARGTFLNYDKTYERKIKEIFIAIELEKKYSKDQILEFYINNVYFANGYYGIEAASQGYFSKPASQLTLSECAFVCSIPNRPTLYNPFEHFDYTISRKKRILKQMYDQKVITKAEYDDATYEDVILDPAEDIKTQDYMTTYAVHCATEALMQMEGFKFRYEFANDAERKAYKTKYDKAYDESNKALYTAGYQIHTSLKKKVQRELQQAVNEKLSGFTSKNSEGTYELQGAATCIDNETGQVIAIVGGRKQKSTVKYTLNRGYQSYRQPGSCFKPLAVYTPQLERSYTPTSIVDDTYFEGGPHNSSGTYSGKITLRRAVEQSKNVVAWRLFQELTPKVGLGYVENMGFDGIQDNDFYPAASLGGLSKGATTVQMASAYCALENNGQWRRPTCITKISDSQGNVVFRAKKKVKSKQVYTATAAENMVDILEGVLVSGTARGYALDNMACAGKTGTTSDKKDGWFCGFTPYYTTTVWVGYDNPRPVSDLYGGTYPLYIWKQFMDVMHQDKEYRGFDKSQIGGSDGTAGIGDDDVTEPGDTEATPTIDPSATPEAGDGQDPDVTTYPGQDSQEPVATAEPEKTKAPAPAKTKAPAPARTKAPAKTKAPGGNDHTDTTDEEAQ